MSVRPSAELGYFHVRGFHVPPLPGLYGHPKPVFPPLPQWATLCRPSGTSGSDLRLPQLSSAYLKIFLGIRGETPPTKIRRLKSKIPALPEPRSTKPHGPPQLL